jgi:excisionase family DNA binding protein
VGRTINELNADGGDQVTLDELLTVEEAAERMRMSARHVRRLVQERRIAFHRLGRSVRIAPDDIAAYVASTRVESAPAAILARRIA